MNTKIKKVLTTIKKEYGVDILYACEAGSRAWGFESPDSDYDVRFVYKHSLPWYLSVNSKKDVIEKLLDKDIDLAGWDVRKALYFWYFYCGFKKAFQNDCK